MYHLYQLRTRTQYRNAIKQIDKLEQRAANSFGSLLSSHDQDELMALTAAMDVYDSPDRLYDDTSDKDEQPSGAF